MWRVTSDYLLAFFDRHLKEEPSPLLDGPSPAHPEVSLGAPETLFGVDRTTSVDRPVTTSRDGQDTVETDGLRG